MAKLLFTAENFYKGDNIKHNVGVFDDNGRIVIREGIGKDQNAPHYRQVAKKIDVIENVRDIGDAFLNHPDCWVDKYNSYKFIVGKGRDIGHGFIELESNSIEVAEIYLNNHEVVEVDYKGIAADCGYYTYDNWGEGDLIMDDDFEKQFKKEQK